MEARGAAGKSRTEYSARNAMVAMLAKMAAILAGFATRIVFTHRLSQEYVGLDGLFSEILNLLSISELGAGTAVAYALYRPVSERNIEKQKSLMRLFRGFYLVVAAAVLAVGLLLAPFMGILIKNQPQIENLIFIFLLYLFKSALSYLMICKRLLMDAHQLSYIGTLYNMLALLLQNLLQMAVLVWTGNFFLYISVEILCVLLNNGAVSRKADRLYPYLRDRKVEKLLPGETRAIFRDFRAMLMHRLGDVMINSTDNLLLSSLVGLVSNSRYSNYYLIIGSAKQVLSQMFQGIAASVGNLGVEEEPGRVKKIFEASFFIGQWVSGVCAIGLFEVIDLFVGLCFGEKYVFTRDVTLVLCVNFYLAGMRQPYLVFRDSMGIFWRDRYRTLAEAAVNLAASVFLGLHMGAVGIFLGTLIGTAATALWVEPYLLYRYGFQCPPTAYFCRFGRYVSATAGLWIGLDLLCRRITGAPWLVFLGRLALCAVVINLAYLFLYHRTGEFRYLERKGKEIVEKHRGR